MFGMLMSVTTKSNLLLRSFCRATTPSSASSASANPLSLSRLRTMRRMVEKASTIKKRRALFATMDPFGQKLCMVMQSATDTWQGCKISLPPANPSVWDLRGQGLGGRRWRIVLVLPGQRGWRDGFFYGCTGFAQQALLCLMGQYGDSNAPILRSTRLVGQQ